jgi:hypothetical protein
MRSLDSNPVARPIPLVSPDRSLHIKSRAVRGAKIGAVLAALIDADQVQARSSIFLIE